MGFKLEGPAYSQDIYLVSSLLTPLMGGEVFTGIESVNFSFHHPICLSCFVFFRWNKKTSLQSQGSSGTRVTDENSRGLRSHIPKGLHRSHNHSQKPWAPGCFWQFQGWQGNRSSQTLAQGYSQEQIFFRDSEVRGSSTLVWRSTSVIRVPREPAQV